ncbi:sensor histidine kinase [Xylanibacillus composti]|uniref:histidine kinase n=1 Tax=Xylanibacillus composti TaxID=1572762 RepID=A0A8J4M444_9BACL|nr:sensor histidine kinase [Xylanibacillus composti]MDT9724714.1 sensor histidine kinase [Xylanibacillus composti]GIQ70715.1 sensor histidine kinase LiaS [Xylanibacillus composti]
MRLSRFNLKWQLVLYGLLTVCLSALYLFVFLRYGTQWIDASEWRWAIWCGPLLIAVAIGYFSGQQLQRRMDSLYVGIFQLQKGNYSTRLPAIGRDPFAKLFDDFNELAESLEIRLKHLQSLGEENVRLQAESNEQAVLGERRRLARDLHDTVSQQLFAIHMSASSLPKVLERDPEKAAAVAEQLIHMSFAAQRQMRGFIAQLRPLELENRSLTEALERWFPDYCNHNNLKGSLNISLRSPLHDALEHQLFLIIQEGMANVVKHADAKHVKLTLQETSSQVLLQIADDGKGFVQHETGAGSHGLSTMRERAGKLGGQLEISSRNGEGCRVKVSIPKLQPATDSGMKEDGQHGEAE